MSTDILFIHPGNQKKTYQKLSGEFTAVATPAWTLLLAQRARGTGHSVAIHDANLEGWDSASPARLLSDYDPSLVVMMVYGHNPNASTQTMPAARMIANDIKSHNPDIPVAMGGIHASALPERTLNEEKVDFVIQGEGAYTIEKLADCIGGKCSREDVPGLWYRKNGAIEHTAPPPVVDDLDRDLDGYAWDLLPPLSRYRAHNMHCFQDFARSGTEDFSDVRSPYVAMNTSLGCPYNCFYCCINAIFDKPRIRYWSLEKVMSWFDVLVQEHGVRNIRFDDELFILSPKRVERFCDMIVERGYDLNLWVYGRVDTINEGLLRKLKRAGVNWICLGIESAVERVRMDVRKNIKKDITEIVKEIQANDIYVLGNYIFGLPEDDEGTMEDTLQLAIDLNTEFANFYGAMALPGSALYRWAVDKGLDVPSDWNAFSQHSLETQPLPTNHIDAATVLRFRDRAFDRYFGNPRFLDMITERFGPTVRKHLERMLEIKLERRLFQ